MRNNIVKQGLSKYVLFGSLWYSCQDSLYSSPQTLNKNSQSQQKIRKAHQNHQALISRRGFLIQGLWCIPKVRAILVKKLSLPG